jgi:hypothetical protein
MKYGELFRVRGISSVTTILSENLFKTNFSRLQHHVTQNLRNWTDQLGNEGLKFH